VAALFESPRHPYTAALLAALPERSGGGRLASIPGVVPGLADRPKGCLFNPRCRFASEACRSIEPPRMGPDLGEALCHYPLSAVSAEAPA
jgi:dipeptide transport system ATP-binding protein